MKLQIESKRLRTIKGVQYAYQVNNKSIYEIDHIQSWELDKSQNLVITYVNGETLIVKNEVWDSFNEMTGIIRLYTDNDNFEIIKNVWAVRKNYRDDLVIIFENQEVRAIDWTEWYRWEWVNLQEREY